MVDSYTILLFIKHYPYKKYDAVKENSSSCTISGENRGFSNSKVSFKGTQVNNGIASRLTSRSKGSKLNVHKQLINSTAF